MGGTKEGGKKAAAKIRKQYGNDFYRFIGSIGGSRSRTGGFASNLKLAREAGAKGGRVSRRPAYKKEEVERIKEIRKAAREEFLQERTAFLKKHGIIIKTKKV